MADLTKRLLDLVFVPKCAVCKIRLKHPDAGLCEECLEKYEDAKAKYCDFCGLEAKICTCTPPIMLLNGCSDYKKLAFYTSGGEHNVVRSMTYSLKRSHNLPLIGFVAREMGEIDEPSTEKGTIVTYAPRSLDNIRKYGYDHAKTMAKYYAQHRNLEMQPIIKRRFFHKSTEQKLLNYRQRAANLKGAYKVKRKIDLVGKTIILIDDVVTSGATIGECASMLYTAGAKNVICRSFAHTYKKNKSKKD